MIYTEEQLNAMTVDQLKAAVNELQFAPDLSSMTSDQLLALTQEDWEKTKDTFETAVKAKAEEEKAALKEKIAAFTDKVLPVIKYVAGAAILLKVFNII